MPSAIELPMAPKNKFGLGRVMSRVFKTKGKDTPRGRSMETEIKPEASRNPSPEIKLEAPTRPTSSSSVQTTYTTKNVVFDDDDDKDMPLTMALNPRRRSPRPSRFSLFGSKTSSTIVPLEQNLLSTSPETELTTPKRTSSPFKKTKSRNTSPEKRGISVAAPYFPNNRTPSPHLQKRRQDSKFSSYSSLNTLSTSLGHSASTAPTSTSSLFSRQRKPSHLSPITSSQLASLQILAFALDTRLNTQEDSANHLCHNDKKLLEQKINLLSHHENYSKMNKKDKELVVDQIRAIRLLLCNKFVRLSNLTNHSFSTLGSLQSILNQIQHAEEDIEEGSEDGSDTSVSVDSRASLSIGMDCKILRDLRISLITDLERQRAVVNEVIDIVERGLTDVGRVLGRSKGERIIVLRFVGFLWARLQRMQSGFGDVEKELLKLGEAIDDIQR